MRAGLYKLVYTDDGTLMQDALDLWYNQLAPDVAPLSLAQRRWVDTADYVEADGRCWGYADVWVPFFRSIFILWLLWAVHLTQTLRGGTNLNIAFQYGVIYVAKNAKRPELAPAVWGSRQNATCWGGTWLFLFVCTLVGRY